MASLDGTTISINDTVYDVVHGPGRVAEIVPGVGGHFRVHFAALGPNDKSRIHLYNSNGVSARHSRRTLYWQNPVLAPPPKNEPRWVLLQQLMRDITARIMAW